MAQPKRFSTLQRVEIAEMVAQTPHPFAVYVVSVLFNESKLLKSPVLTERHPAAPSFSTLQRVEIAEISQDAPALGVRDPVSVLFNESKLLKLL